MRSVLPPARPLLALLLACILAIGCSDDPAAKTADAGPSGADAVADGGDATGGDGQAEDAGADTAQDAGGTDTSGPAPLTPVNRPVSAAPPPAPVTVDGWVYALRGPGDQTGSAVIGGTFVVPKPGTTAYGLQWKAAPLGKGGVLGPFGKQGQSAWLAAVPAVPTAGNYIARVDNVSVAFAPTGRVAGDIYGHGRARVPMRLDPKAPLVLLVRGGRKVRLSPMATQAELWLNDKDLTPPNLRVGHDEPQWLGVPLLNMGDEAVVDVRAKVIESDALYASETAWPAIAPRALTHIGFLLRPKKPWTPEPAEITVQLRVESPETKFAYLHEVKVKVVAADQPWRQTFRSPVDASIQYYGALPPSGFDPSKKYGLALSLHGAGVQAIGQVKAYSPKDWMYVVAPTNRRGFGFDWEEWGHLNGIAALDDAMARFGIDPTRVYVTGHSMGGHGTWQFGVHHADRFAVVGPSAGWDSFYNYGGQAKKPSGPFARPRAQSDTSAFIANLAHRAVYVIHGKADKVVPWTQGLTMHAKAKNVTNDIHHHWEEGAGHWWDGDKSPGVDCVDWPPLFDLMKERTLNPMELNFHFETPGPWYSDKRSYVRILSAAGPDATCVLDSSFDGEKITLTTKNVRTMRIDGAGLRKLGPSKLTIDGVEHDLPDGPLVIGPTTGKRAGVQGPFNQVMHRPWCWVWPDGAQDYANYAAYLSTTWAIIGNGHACALPASKLTAELKAHNNLIHLGGTPAEAGTPGFVSWDDQGVTLGGKTYDGKALQMVYDAGDRLGAVIVAPKGQVRLLYSVVPFSSRSGMPDYLIWGGGGAATAGNFNAEWQL